MLEFLCGEVKQISETGALNVTLIIQTFHKISLHAVLGCDLHLESSSELKCRFIFEERSDCSFSSSHFLSFWVIDLLALLYYIRIILIF